MSEARTESVTVRRDAAAVYEHLAEPTNFPRWSLFIKAIVPDGDGWIAKTPDAKVRIRFAPQNAFGIVDHWVKVNADLEVYVPLRVVANGAESEVLFTVFRLAGMSDQQFEDDLALVRTDLGRLKAVLEGGDVKPGA